MVLVTGGSDFYENFLGEHAAEWLTALFLLLSAYSPWLQDFLRISLHEMAALAFASIFFVNYVWLGGDDVWETPEDSPSLNVKVDNAP